MLQYAWTWWEQHRDAGHAGRAGPGGLHRPVLAGEHAWELRLAEIRCQSGTDWKKATGESSAGRCLVAPDTQNDGRPGVGPSQPYPVSWPPTRSPWRTVSRSPAPTTPTSSMRPTSKASTCPIPAGPGPAAPVPAAFSPGQRRSIGSELPRRRPDRRGLRPALRQLSHQRLQHPAGGGGRALGRSDPLRSAPSPARLPFTRLPLIDPA